MKLSLFLLLLLTSCGDTPPPTPLAPQDFMATPDQAKIFFYADYGKGAEPPSFPETFTLHIDASTVNDIEAGQYIVTEIQPGEHIFAVDQTAWSGYKRSHKELKLPVAEGETIFLLETVLPDNKATLSVASPETGESAVKTRTRKCLCGTALGRYLDSL